MILFDPYKLEDWISIFFFTLGIYAVYHVVISVRELRDFNATKKDLKKHQFVFKVSNWYYLLNLIPLTYLLFRYQGNLILPLFLIVCILTQYTLKLLHQKQIYSVDDNEIVLLSSLSSIKASELTGITFESDNVGFHTAKYQNHYVIERKKLRGKSWSEFLQAVENFAARHDHIGVEKH